MALNHQQTYLLNRLPGRYNRPIDVEPEPAKVRAARKIIEEWENKQEARCTDAEKKWNAAQTVVREAIYFKPAGDALKAVRDFENRFGIVPKP